MIRQQRGLTMVELLVGLAISSFIIVGTIFVYSQSRTTYALNDTQARLQEYGRYSLGILEPDLQLAGYYGFSNNPSDLRYSYNGSEYAISQLEQSDTTVLVDKPDAIHACGNNYVIDLLASVQGTNNKYDVDTGDCAASGGYQDGTDTLTIRRASTAKTVASAGRIQLYINALKRSNQYVFNSSTAPGVTDATREIRDLIVRKYYVSQSSDGRVGVPSLRRKFLTVVGGAPAIGDEEILPGVEDMQIEIGVDTGDHNSTVGIDNDADGNGVPDDPNGIVSRWVEPDDKILLPPPDGVKAQAVAVRVWLRIRSDDPETSYTDTNEYNYAGVKYTPTGTDATYRRTLVTRTVYLRNARTL